MAFPEYERRCDILEEVYTQLDGNGDYVGPWVSTVGADKIRLALDVNGNVTSSIEEGMHHENLSDPHVVRTHSVGSNDAYLEVALTARWYRVVLDAGVASANFKYTVRAVS